MSATFTPEDILTLDKTQKMRERLAAVMMNKEDADLPLKPAALMAATNLLESIDRSVLGRTKLRIDDDSSKNDAANKEILRELMINMHQNQSKPVMLENSPDRPVYVPTGKEISAGELIIKTDTPELPEDLR